MHNSTQEPPERALTAAVSWAAACQEEEAAVRAHSVHSEVHRPAASKGSVLSVSLFALLKVSILENGCAPSRTHLKEL